MKTLVFLLFMVFSVGTSFGQSVESIVRYNASFFEIPQWFAVAIAKQESNLNCAAIGRNGERGAMQIKPSTAIDYGYRGRPSGLNDCQTGIRYGMMYLKAALDKAGGDFYLAALFYNGGLYTKKKRSAYAQKILAGRCSRET